MDNKTHIRLVDTHTKCNGGYNDIDAFHEEIVLGLWACCAIKTCMIRSRFNIIGLENFGKFFHLFTWKTIDNATLSLVLTNEFDDLFIHIIRLWAYFVVEICPIKWALKLVGIHNSEALLDVSTHLVGRCCSQSYDGSIANFVDRWTYIAILRTEVVPPFWYAMSFINGVEWNVNRLEELYILFFIERFWSHIEQLGLATSHVIHHLLDGWFVERWVQIMSHSTIFTHAVYDVNLVFH